MGYHAENKWKMKKRRGFISFRRGLVLDVRQKYYII